MIWLSDLNDWPLWLIIFAIILAAPFKRKTIPVAIFALAVSNYGTLLFFFAYVQKYRAFWGDDASIDGNWIGRTFFSLCMTLDRLGLTPLSEHAINEASFMHEWHSDCKYWDASRERCPGKPKNFPSQQAKIDTVVKARRCLYTLSLLLVAMALRPLWNRFFPSSDETSASRVSEALEGLPTSVSDKVSEKLTETLDNLKQEAANKVAETKTFISTKVNHMIDSVNNHVNTAVAGLQATLLNRIDGLTQCINGLQDHVTSAAEDIVKRIMPFIDERIDGVKAYLAKLVDGMQTHISREAAANRQAITKLEDQVSSIAKAVDMILQNQQKQQQPMAVDLSPLLAQLTAIQTAIASLKDPEQFLKQFMDTLMEHITKLLEGQMLLPDTDHDATEESRQSAIEAAATLKAIKAEWSERDAPLHNHIRLLNDSFKDIAVAVARLEKYQKMNDPNASRQCGNCLKHYPGQDCKLCIVCKSFGKFCAVNCPAQTKRNPRRLVPAPGETFAPPPQYTEFVPTLLSSQPYAQQQPQPYVQEEQVYAQPTPQMLAAHAQPFIPQQQQQT